MTQATISITIPDHAWVHEVSTAHPDATLEILSAIPDDEAGFGLVRVIGPDLPSVLADIDDHPQITEFSLVQWTDRDATVHFETTAPLLLFSAKESGIPIEYPLEVREGKMTVEATGTRERLSELTAQLDGYCFEYRIEQVRERPQTEQVLSERQREVVLAAVEHGYYDTPRECSLTELAEEIGVAKSTCSETLHRAEEAIVKGFVDDLAEPGSDSDPDGPSDVEDVQRHAVEVDGT